MSEREPVGTLAEEAAKLLAAVHAWAGDADGRTGRGVRGQEPTRPARPARRRPRHGESHEHGEHGPAECQWCPLCRLVRMAKATSPEVREHLSQAAISLALAVKGLLDDPATTPRRETPLEKIDLTEE